MTVTNPVSTVPALCVSKPIAEFETTTTSSRHEWVTTAGNRTCSAGSGTVKTGRQSVINYLISPLKQHLNESVRER